MNYTEERQHICPCCEGENVRQYLDITDMGDKKGWVCNDCGYEGPEADFLYE